MFELPIISPIVFPPTVNGNDVTEQVKEHREAVVAMVEVYLKGELCFKTGISQG